MRLCGRATGRAGGASERGVEARFPRATAGGGVVRRGAGGCPPVGPLGLRAKHSGRGAREEGNERLQRNPGISTRFRAGNNPGSIGVFSKRRAGEATGSPSRSASSFHTLRRLRASDEPTKKATYLVRLPAFPTKKPKQKQNKTCL